MSKSELELALLAQIRAVGLPEPVREYRAIEGRKFRFDFAWPDRNLLLEVQGGIWKPQGGHSWGTGIIRDHEKHNKAVLQGWRVLYTNSQTIESGKAIEEIESMMEE